MIPRLKSYVPGSTGAMSSPSSRRTSPGERNNMHYLECLFGCTLFHCALPFGGASHSYLTKSKCWAFSLGTRSHGIAVAKKLSVPLGSQVSNHCRMACLSTNGVRRLCSPGTTALRSSFNQPRSFPANDEGRADRDSIWKPRLVEPAHQRFQEPAKSSPEFGSVTKTT